MRNQDQFYLSVNLLGSGNHCSLPMEIGFCKAAMPRFYYNSLTGECEKFTYGGCGGNKNNFLTKESCLKECKKEEVNGKRYVPFGSKLVSKFFFPLADLSEQKMTTIVMTSGQEIQIFYLFLREVINQIYVTLLLIVSTYVCPFPFC